MVFESKKVRARNLHGKFQVSDLAEFCHFFFSSAKSLLLDAASIK